MNAKQLIAAIVVLAAAGTAFAGEITPFDENEKFVSTKTRAEVIAELAQSRAQGEVVQSEVVVPDAKFASGKSRAEVIAELQEAYAKGELTHGEAYPATAVVHSNRTRDEVRAEAIQAAKNHDTNSAYFGS